MVFMDCKNDPLIKYVTRFIVFHTLNLLSTVISNNKTEMHSPDHPSRILVLDIGMLGDMLMTTPLLADIKSIYPESELTVICTPWAAEAIRNNPHVDVIITYEAFWEDRSTKSKPNFKHVKSTCRVLAYLFKNSYDITFVVTPRQQPIVNFIGYLSRAPIRIGFKYRLGYKFLTHYLEPTDCYLSDLKSSLIQVVAPEYSSLKMMEYFIQANSIICVERYIKNNTLIGSSKYICITPSTLQKSKQWDTASWSYLIDRISKDGLFVFLCGGSADENYISEIYSSISDTSHCYNVSGHFTFDQFAALLSGAELLISIDSAPVHLAAALKVPTLVLCSRVYRYENIIPGESTTVLKKNVDCFECIKGCDQPICMEFSVDEVYDTFKMLVAGIKCKD